MSFEVRCPGCDAGYLVDEKDIGGEFLCPLCQTSIPLTHPSPTFAGPAAAAPNQTAAPVAAAPPAASPATAAPAVATPNAVSATPTAAPGTAAQSPVAPAVATVAAPPSAAAEVCCPRCKLHFVPKGWATRTAGAKKTVLVVEDMTYFKQIAKDALDQRYHVRFAGSNVEAQSILSEGGIDLILLDLNLENGDSGVELLRGLSRKPCPILIFTSKDESEMYGEQWDELQRLGADDLIVKGMNVDDSLVHKVATLLGDPIEEDHEIG